MGGGLAGPPTSETGSLQVGPSTAPAPSRLPLIPQTQHAGWFSRGCLLQPVPHLPCPPSSPLLHLWHTAKWRAPVDTVQRGAAPRGCHNLLCVFCLPLLPDCSKLLLVLSRLTSPASC